MTSALRSFKRCMSVGLLIGLAGCEGDLAFPGTPAEQPQRQVASLPQPARAKPHSIDDEFARIARDEIPGFGGYYFDAHGRFTMYLKNPRTSVGARAAMLRNLNGRKFAVGGDQIQVSEIEVRGGAYDFAELDAWRGRARATLQIPGVVSLDVDEVVNRVRIEVQSAYVEGRVQDALARLGVPGEAVIISRAERPKSLQTLSSQLRPIRGGLRIEHDAYNQYFCTIGFNADREGVRGFVTAGHCTQEKGVLEGTVLHQNEAAVFADRVAYEAHDPPYFTGDGCPEGVECRHSDAAFIRYYDGISSSLGRIAKTTSRSRTSGSTTINPFSQNFVIDANGGRIPYLPPTVGTEVNKMGVTTGWTYGNVTRTCVDTDDPDRGGSKLLCQVYAQAGANEGDSGGPVFMISTGSYVSLQGLLWGRTVTGEIIYSGMNRVEADLGALSVF